MNTRQFFTMLLMICASSAIITAAICIRDYEAETLEIKIELANTTQDLNEAKASVDAVQQQLLTAAQELEKFVDPIQYNVAAAPTYDIPLSKELQQYTYDTCTYYGIQDSYTLVLAMMWQESDFDQDLISSTDDYGLMQINVCNHDSLRETLGIVDFLDPQSNIEAGVYIISTLLQKYDDQNMALMAYNMGCYGASKQWDHGNYSSYYSTSVISKADLIVLNQYS